MLAVALQHYLTRIAVAALRDPVRELLARVTRCRGWVRHRQAAEHLLRGSRSREAGLDRSRLSRSLQHGLEQQSRGIELGV